MSFSIVRSSMRFFYGVFFHGVLQSMMRTVWVLLLGFRSGEDSEQSSHIALPHIRKL